eukprot:7820476-Pyramimonas_sp.AAC.1
MGATSPSMKVRTCRTRVGEGLRKCAVGSGELEGCVLNPGLMEALTAWWVVGHRNGGTTVSWAQHRKLDSDTDK